MSVRNRRGALQLDETPDVADLVLPAQQLAGGALHAVEHVPARHGDGCRSGLRPGARLAQRPAPSASGRDVDVGLAEQRVLGRIQRRADRCRCRRGRPNAGPATCDSGARPVPSAGRRLRQGVRAQQCHRRCGPGGSAISGSRRLEAAASPHLDVGLGAACAGHEHGGVRVEQLGDGAVRAGRSPARRGRGLRETHAIRSDRRAVQRQGPVGGVQQERQADRSSTSRIRDRSRCEGRRRSADSGCSAERRRPAPAGRLRSGTPRGTRHAPSALPTRSARDRHRGEDHFVADVVRGPRRGAGRFLAEGGRAPGRVIVRTARRPFCSRPSRWSPT